MHSESSSTAIAPFGKHLRAGFGVDISTLCDRDSPIESLSLAMARLGTAKYRLAYIAGAVLALAAVLLTISASPLGAQMSAESTFSPLSLAEQEKQAMVAAQRQSAQAQARSLSLEKQAARAASEADKYSKRAAALASHIQAAEADISASEIALRSAERRFAAQQARLDAEQAPILALTTSLLRLSRQPPISILVQPGNLSDLVHRRILLAAALPQIEAQTIDVRRELSQLARLRSERATVLAKLEHGRDSLTTRRARLAQLEDKQRLRARELGRIAHRTSMQAIGLGEQASDISLLLENLEAQAQLRDQLARLDGPIPRPDSSATAQDSPTQPAPIEIVNRTQTNREQGFDYQLPAVGRLLVGMGEVTASGIRARGLTIATQPDAQLVAPASGEIIFADDYGNYGKILIIDHGESWLSLVTGLASLSVAVGDRVEAGYPIGRAPSHRPEITVELRHQSGTVDIVPLLR